MQREERAFQLQGTGWVEPPRRTGDARDQDVAVSEESTFRAQGPVGSKAGEAERGCAGP